MQISMRNTLSAACLFLFMAPLTMMAQSPADLEVLDIQFEANFERAGSTYSSDASVGPSQRITSSWNKTHSGQISAIFRNKGTKPIKSVKWEYLVFRDAQETDLARVYRFHSKKAILPGESKRLKKTGYTLVHTAYKKVRVTRIDYGDGTVWRGTTTKK